MFEAELTATDRGFWLLCDNLQLVFYGFDQSVFEIVPGLLTEDIELVIESFDKL